MTQAAELARRVAQAEAAAATALADAAAAASGERSQHEQQVSRAVLICTSSLHNLRPGRPPYCSTATKISPGVRAATPAWVIVFEYIYAL